METLYHFDAEPLAFHNRYGRELQAVSAELPEVELAVNERARRGEHENDSLEPEAGGKNLLRGILVAALFEVTVILGFLGVWHLWLRLR